MAGVEANDVGGTGGRLDFYREWRPPIPWRGAVACCWEQRVDADRRHRVVPDGHADILIDGSGAVAVVGLHDRVDEPFLAAGTWIRGVRLHPHVVATALRVDASSIRNRTIPLADVLGSRQARRLIEPRALDAWVRSVEPRARTARAVRLLATQSVDRTADALGISSRQLHRVMVAEVGLGPKAYQRVLRLQRFLAVADEVDRLAVVAAEAGYADQPHLTREVRALTGLTPNALLRERRGRFGRS